MLFNESTNAKLLIFYVKDIDHVHIIQFTVLHKNIMRRFGIDKQKPLPILLTSLRQYKIKWYVAQRV
jgi:predicted metalloprotease